MTDENRLTPEDLTKIRCAFDPNWYAHAYPDVAASGEDLFEHYIKHGRHERRKPNEVANSALLEEMRTVGKVNVLQVVSAWGEADAEEIMIVREDTVSEAETISLENSVLVESNVGSQVPTISADDFTAVRNAFEELFDEEWYLANNPDLSSSEIALFDHFVIYGHAEGRQPNSFTKINANNRDSNLEDDKGESDLQFYINHDWYLTEYPDLHDRDILAIDHYFLYGEKEGRQPNSWFDPAWYLANYADVAGSATSPLTHYVTWGIEEQRNPGPDFDAHWYVRRHPKAERNPLLFHLLIGERLGYETKKPFDLQEYLTSGHELNVLPTNLKVAVVVPVYKGLTETKACLQTLIQSVSFLEVEFIVINDASPDAELSCYLDQLAADNKITLVINEKNQGFVKSVNIGMCLAQGRDIVLLNSDTEVSGDWLERLASHAYGSDKVGTISPFSNNATICSYPSFEGGDLPNGFSLDILDKVFASANKGRSIELPTTVGFCMYISARCLAEVGSLDAETFGRGYGEETDFCLRASALGWKHLLACDVFVYHAGQVSFGTIAPERYESQITLDRRYPRYRHDVSRFVELNPASSSWWAATAALFRTSPLDVVLLITHDFGGGVGHHISEITKSCDDTAHFLVLAPKAGGFSLNVVGNGLNSIPTLHLPSKEMKNLATIILSAGVSHVHIHHWIQFGESLSKLLDILPLPLTISIHDYFSICPQIQLIQKPGDFYCGEPDEFECNSCIRNFPNDGAADITWWRQKSAALLARANTIICPTNDVKDRLARYGLADRAVVIPHERPVERRVGCRLPSLGRHEKLRIAVIGVLAEHKGRSIVAELANLMVSTVEITIIGYVEDSENFVVPSAIQETGPYKHHMLEDIVDKVDPHVIWYPAQWPETYSYTLSAGLASGRPIAASNLGSFPERLGQRRFSWLINADANASEWRSLFETIRGLLESNPKDELAHNSKFEANTKFKELYRSGAKASAPFRLVAGKEVSRASPDILVVPECFENGIPTPCGYIRLVQPFTHKQVCGDLNVLVGRAEDLMHLTPRIVVCQRHFLTNMVAAQAFMELCRAKCVELIYDIDDDLLDLNPGSQSQQATELSDVVDFFLRNSDQIWCSTHYLADSAALRARDVKIVPNLLDERVWRPAAQADDNRISSVRFLYMGTITHERDYMLMEPDFLKLRAEFGPRVELDIVGITTRSKLPDGIKRLSVPTQNTRSYPSFVNWLTREGRWDVGLAPLENSRFNASKSSVKVLDYAALGLMTLASDVTAYRGSLARLVPEGAGAWYREMRAIVRNPRRRQNLRAMAVTALNEEGTLSSGGMHRRRILQNMLSP